jgi:hypothetical protein
VTTSEGMVCVELCTFQRGNRDSAILGQYKRLYNSTHTKPPTEPFDLSFLLSDEARPALV